MTDRLMILWLETEQITKSDQAHYANRGFSCPCKSLTILRGRQDGSAPVRTGIRSVSSLCGLGSLFSHQIYSLSVFFFFDFLHPAYSSWEQGTYITIYCVSILIVYLYILLQNNHYTKKVSGHQSQTGEFIYSSWFVTYIYIHAMKIIQYNIHI